MTKSKSKKAAKALEKRISKHQRQLEIGAQAPPAAIAMTAADGVSRIAKKQAKGGGSKWWGLLAGAAKMAGELAPLVAPLLMAKHGPSAQLAASSGAAMPAGVPLASSASCATCTGIVQLKAKYGADGRVRGITIQGLDYLGALAVNSEVAGSVLSTINLNPYDPAWNGTALQRFATLFERYRPRRVAALVEPSCAATTDGQIISFIDPDPDDSFEYTGRQAIQVAASHEGADISQVWGMNAAAYAFDKRTQDFYADADGSDERLISPGMWRVLANTDMPASTPIGSLYVAWDYEFLIPQIEERSQGGSWARLDTTTTAMPYPLGPDPWVTVQNGGDIHASLSVNGTATANQITGLPPGEYVGIFVANGCTADATVPGPALQGSYTDLTIIENLLAGSGPFDVHTSFAFSVPVHETDPALGALLISLGETIGDTVAECLLVLTTIDSSFSAPMTRKHRTLQELEAEFEALIAAQKRETHSAAAAAASSATSHVPAPRHRYLRSSALPLKTAKTTAQ